MAGGNRIKQTVPNDFFRQDSPAQCGKVTYGKNKKEKSSP
jgi:hypothetical protein